MTTVVSFTDFRDNLSTHLDYLKKGNKIIIKNAKKGKDVVTLVAEKEKEFDWDEYINFVKSLGESGFLANKKDEATRKKFRESVSKRFAKAIGK